MPLKSSIKAKRSIVRFSYEGKVSYGLYNGKTIRIYQGSPFGRGKPTKDTVALSKVSLLAPCRPSKVVAVGLNYKAHAKEMDKKLPDEPMLFLKPSSSVIGPDDVILMPPSSSRVDYEAELAVVIQRSCHEVGPEEAPDYILGYTCLNDVTARDLQKKDGQFTRGKGFDTFCPIGPSIALELSPDNLMVSSQVNGKTKQKSRTSDLIFGINELVSFISHVMTLRPGDVIATGTPSGVGPLADGDTVAIEIQGIGVLSNPVVAKG